MISFRRPRWAVMISGRGSNLQALLRSPSAASIALVVSSKTSADGAKKARRAGCPVIFLERAIDWERLDQSLREHRIERIFLAGFMRVLPADFVQRWQGQMLNVHPSLLPKYPGLKSIERAYEAGDDLGVTVHEVSVEVDQGRQVLQGECGSALPFSTLEAAALAVHVMEHRLVRRAVERWPSDQAC